MSIASSALLEGSTIAASGGTSVNLLVRGGDFTSVKTILDDSSSFLEQTRVDFTTRAPNVNTGAPNGYTQIRNSVKIAKPKVLLNGNSTLNTITVSLGCDVETSIAEKGELLKLIAQVLTDASFDDFWQSQSVE